MNQVIPTRGISHRIEEIISKAEKEIILVTPFLKITSEYYTRLIEASKRNVAIILLYGKKELEKEQEKMLFDIDSLEIRYLKNLHAKVYLNENEGVISSMNLYKYSEVNNFELGVYFKRNELDLNYIYRDAYNEVQHMISQSELKKERCNKKKKENLDIAKSIFYSKDYENFLFENMPIKGLDISKRYGFVTYHIQEDLIPYQHLKKFRGDYIDLLRNELEKEYRLYWSSPYDKICIYHKKGINFFNEKEEFEYCTNAINKLNSKIKNLVEGFSY